MLPEPNYPVSPDQFVGRKTPGEAFTLALQQGIAAGRISSFAVLGDWGIGKSSLLLTFAAICSDPKYGLLPVLVPVSTDYADYRRFAESLLDGLAEALAATSSLTTRLHAEVRNWKLKRVSMGGFTLDREAQRFFLSSAAPFSDTRWAKLGSVSSFPRRLAGQCSSSTTSIISQPRLPRMLLEP